MRLMRTKDKNPLKKDTKIISGTDIHTKIFADEYARRKKSYAFEVFEQDYKTGKLLLIGYGIPK